MKSEDVSKSKIAIAPVSVPFSLNTKLRENELYFSPPIYKWTDTDHDHIGDRYTVIDRWPADRSGGILSTGRKEGENGQGATDIPYSTTLHIHSDLEGVNATIKMVVVGDIVVYTAYGDCSVENLGEFVQITLLG
ncbi:MAG: hypothetical protein HRU20_21640 [Pseudomonadales bacterium]|nr:hypothetical protein [Pseudomonadales bacterium]